MGKKRSFIITEEEKQEIKNLYKIFISEQPMSSPVAASQSYTDFNDYHQLAIDIVTEKLCNFDNDFENFYPARKKTTNDYIIVATAKVDRPIDQTKFYYKKGDLIEFNIGAPVSGGIYFTNVTQKRGNFYFSCDKLSQEVTRVTKKLEDLLGQKGFFSANSPQLQNYQNQLNDRRYFEQKTIEELAIDYKNSMGFNPLYYNGPKIFYKSLQNTTENIQLTTKQQEVKNTFVTKFGAIPEDALPESERYNYNPVNLKSFDTTFKDDYIMFVPRSRMRDVNKMYKQGATLLQIDNENIRDCTKLFETYKELYHRYRNTPNLEPALTNIKPNLEYCYSKFRKTKLGGEMFPFTNENDKSLGPFLLNV
jgi:hypothetical protein